MNRVCLTKTGKLIEMQSGGDLFRASKDAFIEEYAQKKIVFTENDYQIYLDECDALETMRLNTLKQNALNAGYKEDEIDVRWVTNAEWAAIQEANKPILIYADLRRREYPLAADYLDGIVKGDKAQVQKYIDDCLAVKAKYPKPERAD